MKILFSCTGVPTDIEEGDALIVKTDYFFSFYYVVQSKCKLIEKVKTIKFMRGNVKYGIVFEYATLVPRKGIKEELLFFAQIFKEKATVGFLQNALDILSYKDDKWDVSILQSLLFAEQYTDEKTHKTSFIDFLDEKAKDYYWKRIENGSPVPEAYRLTKTAYPTIFAQSLKQFKLAYPGKSIYDNCKISEATIMITHNNKL